ncbi:MAG: alpha/beta fold hydrolase [Gammaproteobacteria bacterium]
MKQMIQKSPRREIGLIQTLARLPPERAIRVGKTRYLKARRSTLNTFWSQRPVRVAGERPMVIGLHAGAGAPEQCWPLAARLRLRYHVLAAAFHGDAAGRAPGAHRPPSLEAEATRIEPLLDAFPGPVYLVGHDYGAAVALKLARRRSDARKFTSNETSEGNMRQSYLFEPSRLSYQVQSGVDTLGFGAVHAVPEVAEDVAREPRAGRDDGLADRRERLLERQAALASLTQSPVFHGDDLEQTIRQVTEMATRLMRIERASLWRYTEARTAIRCIDLYERGQDRHGAGMEIDAGHYPAYFEALATNEAIVADDAHTDPRTSELAHPYLAPLGITAMMDIPVHLYGRLEGVLCHEQVGSRIAWTAEDRLFGIAVANLIALAIEHHERQRAERALAENEERLSRIIEGAMDAIVTLDGEGRITLFNHAAEQVFYCPAGAALGRAFADYLSSDFRCALEGHMDARGSRASKQAVWLPPGLMARRADGTEFPVEATLSRVEANGQPLYTLILRDIEKRRRQEAAFSRLHGLTLSLQDEIQSEHNFAEIIGGSGALKAALEAVEQVAPTDATVLVTGETGTGKELIARAIHDRSRRKAKALVKLNCATLPAGLVESELFGHEKGSFTGAYARKLGRFEVADGGTLFLDEIGEMPLELQSKLLRVLQEGEFERVGGSQTLKVDVRVVTATNRDLEAYAREGKFRSDLYYRLNVFPIPLPLLRERREDIPALVRHFVGKYAAKLGKRIETVTPAPPEYSGALPNIRESRPGGAAGASGERRFLLPHHGIVTRRGLRAGLAGRL